MSDRRTTWRSAGILAALSSLSGENSIAQPSAMMGGSSRLIGKVSLAITAYRAHAIQRPLSGELRRSLQ